MQFFEDGIEHSPGTASAEVVTPFYRHIGG